MKRFIGFVIAVAGIIALVFFKTFKSNITSEEYSMFELFKNEGWFKYLLETIKVLFKDGSKESWISIGCFAIGIIGLPLSLLLAGLCKKFGRFFWGLLAVGCCVFGSLMMFGKIFEEYSLLYVYVARPFIGYFIAGGCGAVLMIMPIAFRD